jgi:hypothetical protein
MTCDDKEWEPRLPTAHELDLMNDFIEKGMNLLMQTINENTFKGDEELRNDLLIGAAVGLVSQLISDKVDKNYYKLAEEFVAEMIHETLAS